MKKNKAVFLDRDGTINWDKDYLYRIQDFELIPGVVEALHILNDMGYLLIIVTNQSGIARGYYSEEDFLKLNTWMLDELKQQGIIIKDTYYCPHLPDGIIEKYKFQCDCRKPSLGMFEKAIKEHHLDISKSIAIGDKDRDVEISRVYGIDGYRLYAKRNALEGSIHFIEGGLLEAANDIRNRYGYKQKC